jgi:hypothetical protein
MKTRCSEDQIIGVLGTGWRRTGRYKDLARELVVSEGRCTLGRASLAARGERRWRMRIVDGAPLPEIPPPHIFSHSKPTCSIPSTCWPDPN